MARQDLQKDADLDRSFNTDKDLNEVWPEVIAEFERVTEKKLDPGTTFASFQSTVNETLREATSKRTSNARIILNNVGQCLQQFGALLADGASMAFGPSAQCWNAISFVISAAQKYSAVFDGFITLMERCAAFLSRLNIFLEQECGKHDSYLPSHLRKPAYAILTHFIDILKHSYKLSKSKREKFKLVLEIVLFSGDAGVQSALDLLEQQVQDFTNTQIDQILVDVKGLARYLRDSEESRQQHHSEIREHLERIYEVGEETLAVTQQMKITLDGHITQEKNREDLDKIRKAFGFKAGEEPWTKRHDHICKVRIKNSSSWLIEREDLGFFSWADVKNRQSQTKVVIVEGDSGYGKSFVSNKVISYLQDLYRSNNASDRVLIAYYYYGEDREDSLEKCIRCIIYQFASAEPAYARAVAEACQQPGNIAKSEDIWERLIVKLQHAMKGTYYICIDGYDCQSGGGSPEDAITGIVHTVSSGIKGLSLRLYLSGTNDAVARIPQEDRAIRRIPLGPVKDLGNKLVRLTADSNEELGTVTTVVNASDLEAVALARIEELGQKKPDLKTVMTEANIKKLVAGIHGNYDHLEAKIIQINACDTEQKIQNVIDSSGDDLTTSVRSSLKVLSESLTPEQIHMLNQLLIWIVSTGSSPIEFLQSALYLAFKKTFMLRDMIATTFSGFFVIDENDDVKVKSDQVLQILREESNNHVQLSRPGTSITQLSQAEIDLCSAIVKNVCGEQVFGRFNFDDFFDSLAGKQKVSIQVADENALNVLITRTLLQAFCEPKEEQRLKTIRLYASIWFYEHLKNFVEKLDYFEPDRQLLTEIGEKLSCVLFDHEAIDIWFSGDRLLYIKQDFVGSDLNIDSILKILRNPHVAKGYAHDAEKKKWLESVISPGANKYAIFRRVARCIAARWFTCQTITDPDNLWIPYGIFSKETTGKFDPDTMPSLEEAAKFLLWVQEDNDLDSTSSIWSYRVGSTYKILEHYEEALKKFKEVEGQLQDNWLLPLLIGECYIGLKDFSAALTYLHKVKGLHGTLIETDPNFKVEYWDRILLPEAECHRQIKDYDAAIQCYRDILPQEVGSELYPGAVHSEALNSLFNIWEETGRHNSIVPLLRELRDSNKPQKGMLYWLGTVIGYQEQLHNHILKAAKRSGAIEEVSRMYDEAIAQETADKVANAQKPGPTTGISEELRYYRAVLKFYGSSSDEDHNEALEAWQDIMGESSNATWLAFKAFQMLARSLLEKAATERLSHANTETGTGYGTRLEALCRSDSIRGVRQSTFDPCLCLARMHVLRKNDTLADEEARNLLRGVFDNWPTTLDDESLPSRFVTLAQTLCVFDMDEDAMAAWQALKPRSDEQTATEDGAKPDASAVTDEKAGQDVKLVVDESASTNKSQAESKESESASQVRKAYISGYICDACSQPWENILADAWACKYCLCVQLCSPCHQKLLSDELSPVVCSKEHAFLYLPKFDEAAWASVPDNSVLVGGRLMLRDEWLDRLRTKWGVQQEQIDSFKLETARKLKATICITKFILKWKRKRLMKIRRARTIPLFENP